MSGTEKKNTLLVVNLDASIVGDKLIFQLGSVKTLKQSGKLTRDGRWQLRVVMEVARSSQSEFR